MLPSDAVVNFRDGQERRETHLLNKGNYLTPGDKVEPGLLSSFSAICSRGCKDGPAGSWGGGW